MGGARTGRIRPERDSSSLYWLISLPVTNSETEVGRVDEKRDEKTRLASLVSPPSAAPPPSSKLSTGARERSKHAPAMKVTINHYHAVATWKWNLKSSTAAALDQQGDHHAGEQEKEDDDDDDDDDVCGICRVAFDGCCPDCKIPGDGCPPGSFPLPLSPHTIATFADSKQTNKQTKTVWGECTHVFHLHCLTKWLATESSKGQCPMDRRQWGQSLLLSFSSHPKLMLLTFSSCSQSRRDFRRRRRGQHRSLYLFAFRRSDPIARTDTSIHFSSVRLHILFHRCCYLCTFLLCPNPLVVPPASGPSSAAPDFTRSPLLYSAFPSLREFRGCRINRNQKERESFAIGLAKEEKKKLWAKMVVLLQRLQEIHQPARDSSLLLRFPFLFLLREQVGQPRRLIFRSLVAFRRRRRRRRRGRLRRSDLV